MAVWYVTRFELSPYWQTLDIPFKPTSELRHATLWQHLSVAEIYLLSKWVVAHCNTSSINDTIYQTEFCYTVFVCIFLTVVSSSIDIQFVIRDKETSPQIFKHCTVSINGMWKFCTTKNVNSAIRLFIKRHCMSFHVKW